MIVYVDHAETSTACPGGGSEVWESPASAGCGHWRVRAAEQAAGVWGLAVERRGGGGWEGVDWLLLARTDDRSEYMAWLNDNVEYVEVDGHVLHEAD